MRFRHPTVRAALPEFGQGHQPGVRSRWRVARGVLLLSVTSLVTAGLAVAGFAATAQAADVTVRHSCPTPVAGSSSCFALQRTDANQPSGIKPGGLAPLGFGAGDLQSAYNLSSSSAKGGAGQTVAIVDAFNDPSAETDLAVYRAQYRLPPCTAVDGCFSKVNQTGALTPLPKNHGGWADEISLDVDMVSAVCPNCKILLIETNSATNADLYAGVNQAVQMGAKFISTSWGSNEYAGETTFDSTFNHPGVAITASSGAGGDDATYPATSPYVTSVGGTTLTGAADGKGWAESAWSGTGSGCSGYEAKPAWQTVDTECANRAESDVSAVADPATGVSVYETYGDDGWQVYGGTSVGAPIVAALYALAGMPPADSSPASFPYLHAASLNDVTTGSNGDCGAPLCTAGTGWDGPTGLGTPNGSDAFSGAKPPPAPNTVTVTNPGAQTATVGTAFSLQIEATDSDSSQTLSYTATGLPDGESIDPSSGLISGTPTKNGGYASTVTATDSTGASGTVSFSTTVTPAPNTVTVASPAAQSAMVGTAFSLQIEATDSDGSQTLGYAAAGLPAGLTIDKGTGLISGTPTADGSFLVAVTATDGTGASGSASFTTTVKPRPNTVTVIDPGAQTATVGTAFSLQIAGIDSDSTQALSYTASGLPDGLTIDKGTGLISGTPTIDGSAAVTVTATDGTEVSGSITFQIKVNPACIPAQLLGNPGFETGTAAPWTTTPGVVTTGNGQTAHTGTYFAWMDGYGSAHTDTVSQTVTIPSKCTKTTLTFWLKVASLETSTTQTFDKMTVKVGPDTLATYSNLDKGASYMQRTLPLGAYAGQTVTLTFTGVEDASVQTSFILDDTAISTS